MPFKTSFFALILVGILPSHGKLHKIGFGNIPADFKNLSKMVADGDSVEFSPGNYPNAEAVWRASSLTLFCDSGYAKMQAPQISNKKAIWVVQGNNALIKGIEFTGAKVEDKNGAGIRAEGENLAIQNCYFHHNENGILGGKGILRVEHSIFENNGHGDGYSHNIYLSQRVSEFSLSFCISRLTKIGHNVKSRAAKNIIEFNYIADEKTGNSSYGIDLPNGGIALIKGNILHKGLRAQNEALISYGAEGIKHQENKFVAVNNTLVSEYPGSKFIRLKNFQDKAVLLNNLYAGNGIFSVPFVDSPSNIKVQISDFMPLDSLNYYLPNRVQENYKGEKLPQIHGLDLGLEYQYKHPAQKIKRSTLMENPVGALQLP